MIRRRIDQSIDCFDCTYKFYFSDITLGKIQDLARLELSVSSTNGIYSEEYTKRFGVSADVALGLSGLEEVLRNCMVRVFTIDRESDFFTLSISYSGIADIIYRATTIRYETTGSDIEKRSVAQLFLALFAKYGINLFCKPEVITLMSEDDKVRGYASDVSLHGLLEVARPMDEFVKMELQTLFVYELDPHITDFPVSMFSSICHCKTNSYASDNFSTNNELYNRAMIIASKSVGKKICFAAVQDNGQFTCNGDSIRHILTRDDKIVLFNAKVCGGLNNPQKVRFYNFLKSFYVVPSEYCSCEIDVF